MTQKNIHKKIMISLGGSIIVPNGKIAIPFLIQLKKFIQDQLADDPTRQFFLVVGGGGTARHYRDAGHDVVGHDLTHEDLDWLGIHATRLNAHLVRTIFQDIAHPHIIKDYTVIQKTSSPVIVAAGWKPGWSTDYCATLLCEDYGIQTLINLSNITQVYNKDPNQFPDAKPQTEMTWDAFRDLVGDKWVPGMHAPFDPIASKKGQELGIEAVVMSGTNFDNLENYFKGEKFVGTVIK